MSRAQTGISPFLPKSTLIVSFRVRDIPMTAMSVGHVAANVPGLANEFRKSTPSGSDLVYTIGFGWQLWNFIWQGAMPPGFSHLEVPEETEDEIEEDDEDSGPSLIFSFSASQPDILQELAEQSQTHLKNIADVHDMILGTPVESPASHLRKEEIHAGAFISNKYPEYAESSYLLNLRLDPLPEDGSELPTVEKEIRNKLLARDFLSLTENEPGLIHHLYAWEKEKESGHHLMAYCDHVKPFQNILDRLAEPSADSLKAPWDDIKSHPSLYFLPSLEILAGLRMGTLRMGPLSPTARWK
jgi:porphyrinogen peroxidase